MLAPYQIKKDFPILQQPHPSGKPLIYLDSAATTQKPQEVIDTMHHYYEKSNANVHRGIHHLGNRATLTYESTRAKVQTFINAHVSRDIIFTKGTTESVNLVAYGFAAKRLQPGDEIIISAMEHHSNLIPWQMLCKRHQAHLRVIPMQEDGQLDLSQLKQMLNPKTKMLAVVHISNSLGTINPVEEIIEMAHAADVPVLVDAAQSAAYYDIDVQQMDCDFLVFSGHKVFGPTGIGVLYGKEKWLEEMDPWQFGGEMIRSVTFEETTFAEIPQKFEAGTPNIAGAAGLAAAIRYIENIGKADMQQHLQDLLQYATEQLLSINGLHIYGNAPKKSAIISFMLDFAHAHDTATILDSSGIAVRAGHHCTQPVMDFYGIPATARASFSIYNTREDIDVLAEAVENVRMIFVGTL
ncbi:MAG: cysteine desulfurase [Saprospiraceae bacterium]|nr:cysteine desulfurase [Saprospiraceae bacterium]